MVGGRLIAVIQQRRANDIIRPVAAGGAPSAPDPKAAPQRSDVANRSSGWGDTLFLLYPSLSLDSRQQYDPDENRDGEQYRAPQRHEIRSFTG